MTTMHVDPGDPHNDQVLAQTVQDLEENMAVIRDVLEQAEKQGAPLSSIMAVIAIGYSNNKAMNRERLASLLALSMIQNHAHVLKDEASEFAEFIKGLRS